MARLLYVSFLVIFLVLLQTAFAPDIDGRPRDPRPRPDGGGRLEAHTAPFSEPEEEGHELVSKINDLLQQISSIISTSCTSLGASAAATSSTFNIGLSSLSNSLSLLPGTSTPTSTSPAGPLNATLACQIYSTYTSWCPTTTIKPYTTTLTSPSHTRTVTPDAAVRSNLAESARAGCLCYSNTYFVPSVYDYAASVCASYTGANSALETAATSAAAQSDGGGFCSSIGNVANKSTATFGQYPAATAAAGRLFGGTVACCAAVAVVVVAFF